MAGPLNGVRIVEFAGLGPAPFCGMMLADHGAEVTLIDRPVRTRAGASNKDILNRSRKSIALDMKHPKSIEIIRKLVKSCDGIIEGLRPGVMERLGLGPDVLLKDNPKLVYGRMTGWGQTGPEAKKAGHDINYIALSGVLDACGRAGEKPKPAVNLVGDFGGGGMMLAFGMLAGILSARSTGVGQVVDCAMLDGSALLSSMIWALRAQGRWEGARGENLLDTGAHFYDTYETLDGLYVAVGAIEPQFYAQFCQKLGVADDPAFQKQIAPEAWPALKDRVSAILKTKTRAQWEQVFADVDACFSPILSMREVMEHPHNQERELYIDVDGVRQPAPGPRFSKMPADRPVMPGKAGEQTNEVLEALGFSAEEISAFRAEGLFGQVEESAFDI
jgi:alpha-methylacyl-CoA racemase